MDDPIVARALDCYPALREPHATPIAQGWIHQTWRVEDGDRRYVLQQLNPIFSLAVHENIEAVTARLAERGIETPRLERSASGELFARPDEAGPCFRLMSWIEGVAHDRCSSTQLASSAGRLVARFHGALDGLAHEFEPLGIPFHDTPLYLAELRTALQECTGHPLHGEVASLAARIEDATASWQPLGPVPDRVVHLDLKFNNILFRGEPGSDEACCLIDLDTLSRMPLWVELGDAWRSWCNRRPEHESRAEYDPAIFEASAGAWLDTLCFDLEGPELASLAHGIERLCVELASRFAADALRESYFGWNPALFESAGAHNLSRTHGQLSLHDQARATRDDRLRFLTGRRS